MKLIILIILFFGFGLASCGVRKTERHEEEKKSEATLNSTAETYSDAYGEAASETKQTVTENAVSSFSEAEIEPCDPAQPITYINGKDTVKVQNGKMKFKKADTTTAKTTETQVKEITKDVVYTAKNENIQSAAKASESSSGKKTYRNGTLPALFAWGIGGAVMLALFWIIFAVWRKKKKAVAALLPDENENA